MNLYIHYLKSGKAVAGTLQKFDYFSQRTDY